MDFIKRRGDKFVDGGDPDSADFGVGDFTTDDTWNDLDLSSIIPVGTKMVLLSVLARCATNNAFIEFRKNGNSHAYALAPLVAITANLYVGGVLPVAVDDNLKIEYLMTNFSWHTINVTVLAWFV